MTFCDIFLGTATVGDYFNGFYKIIANDFLDFSYQISKGILLGYKAIFKKLGFDPFEYFKKSNYKNYTQDFCYNTFSPNGGRQYFSDDNAKYIDFIRDTIDKWYNENKIDDIEIFQIDLKERKLSKNVIRIVKYENDICYSASAESDYFTEWNENITISFNGLNLETIYQIL